MSITVAKHPVQQYILTKLTQSKIVRFSDLKPPKVRTNLVSYHLKLLVESDLVEHTGDGYSLGLLGLAYIDRLNDDGIFAYQQPKMATMFVIQNSDGGLLLEWRSKQPYIDTWTLPMTKLSIDDESLHDAAVNEIENKFGLRYNNVRHAGDCYIRVYREDAPLTVTFVHVFAFESDNMQINSDYKWVKPHRLHQEPLAPAVDQIVARTFFRDPFFFEEFRHDW